MKIRQAITFVICILSMFLIFFILFSAKVSINAAATTGGKVSLSILPPTPKTVCGNGICETGETCPADCTPKQDLRTPTYSNTLLELVWIMDRVTPYQSERKNNST